MKCERKFELLQNANETLSTLSEIYAELASIFLMEQNKANSELFLDKSEKALEEGLSISKLTISTFELDKLF